ARPPSSPSVAYGAWLGNTSSLASGGTYRQATDGGLAARFPFRGTSVRWLTLEGPFSGQARVRIDGVDRGIVDLYAAADAAQAYEFGGLADGPHVLTVTALGTKNPAAGAAFVAIDAFQAGGATFEENDASIRYD